MPRYCSIKLKQHIVLIYNASHSIHDGLVRRFVFHCHVAVYPEYNKPFPPSGWTIQEVSTYLTLTAFSFLDFEYGGTSPQDYLRNKPPLHFVNVPHKQDLVYLDSSLIGGAPLYKLFTLAHHHDINHHFLNQLICAAAAAPLSGWIIVEASGRVTAARTPGMESLRTVELCLQTMIAALLMHIC